MADIIPITLNQDNLGRRHRQLNSFVKLTYDNRYTFESIRHVTEKSPLDRLFKIDYASKLKNVDYILQNIKDEDMLYVSRALKCKWLVEKEYRHIICPNYLENILYPDMITTAINKMKNWLYLHLKDPERCEVFYKFYYKANLDYAMKFLSHCSDSLILEEMPKVIEKISPHYFKIFCESCPQVAKVYFDIMLENDMVKKNFLDNHNAYYNSFKVVLKQDPEMFFDIIEKYFNIQFSGPLTKYILKNHKDKFKNKIELYSSSLLKMQSMADCLHPDECKEVVLTLARAKYLEYWFSYKAVEPLIKRLSVEERPTFKKQIFVDKNIGEIVNEWPYNTPTLPTIEDFLNDHIFAEPKPEPLEYLYDCDLDMAKCSLKCNFFRQECFSRCIKVKTYLDKLFDEYRYVGFTKALVELSRRMRVESSLQNREYILLVLVSKCGRQPENLASLFKLLEKHSNEPAHLRAAIVRSLVKRAAVWRLPQDTWEALIPFARGLGLDGNTPEADCREGLHAVVIRNLLTTGSCEQLVRDAFLREFSDFNEYLLNPDEKKTLSIQLPALLMTAVDTEGRLETKGHYLTLLLDTLRAYKVNVETTTLIPAVASLAKCDASVARDLLQRLFDLKISRRTLFYENFQFIQNGASYINALRHDISIIEVNKLVDLLEKGDCCMDQFLRKITIYFTDKCGLFDRCLTEIRHRVLEKPEVKLTIVRPLCLLQGANLQFILAMNSNTKHGAKLSAAVRANMHLGRPKLDMTGIDLSVIGAKACANKVVVCPKTRVNAYVKDLLKWKRTVRVAIVLAERTDEEAESITIAVTLRPTTTLKAAIKYFRRRGDSFDPRVWEAIKGTLQSVDYTTAQRQRLRDTVCTVKYIPLKIRAEYCTILYSVLNNKLHPETMQIMYQIENLITEVKADFMEEIILGFLNKPDSSEDKNLDATCLYYRVIVKYLLFSKTESIQKARLETLSEPFFNRLQVLLKTHREFMVIFDAILGCLQSNKMVFDVTYVSPLPVTEKIISWMRINLPIEIYFNKYVAIHLTMLYFKAVRHSMIQYPDIFAYEKRKMKEGVDVVGHIFGVYIAKEVKDLISKYFESVIELYRNGITEYFDKYHNFGVSKSHFIIAIVKGILESCVGSESKIAVYLLQHLHYGISKKTKVEIIEKMKRIENVELKFFLFSEFYAYNRYVNYRD